MLFSIPNWVDFGVPVAMKDVGKLVFFDIFFPVLVCCTKKNLATLS
jgi:hypothetical protein